MIEAEGRRIPLWVVIVAGGSGTRFGGELPKQFTLLAGHPVLAWTVSAFEETDAVDYVIIVAPEAYIQQVACDVVDPCRFSKVRRIVPGGRDRQGSTAGGVAAVEDDDAVVLVHDGVRPFPSPGLITACAQSAAECGSGLTATPVTDTIKRVDPDGRVVETVPREHLWAAQTPQAFHVGVLRRALSAADESGFRGTDEAQLVERIGERVALVEGEPSNLKITTRSDLARAELIATERTPPC